LEQGHNNRIVNY